MNRQIGLVWFGLDEMGSSVTIKELAQVRVRQKHRIPNEHNDEEVATVAKKRLWTFRTPKAP